MSVHGIVEKGQPVLIQPRHRSVEALTGPSYTQFPNPVGNRHTLAGIVPMTSRATAAASASVG